MKSAFAMEPTIIANADDARRIIRAELREADVRTVLICLGTANDALPRTVRITPEVLAQLAREVYQQNFPTHEIREQQAK